MKKGLVVFVSCCIAIAASAQKDSTVKKKDRKKDVLLQTSYGDMIVRLSDSTPLHRDNFLKLVKVGFYDSVLFHRVINNFMIQAGDPGTKRKADSVQAGNGSAGYTIPAEFRQTLFHKKGAIAAARTGDNVNPQKASSSSQFYLVQGRVFTEAGLDSTETFRLKRKLPDAHREVYKTLGGTPHLDQNYTVFGEVMKGLEVIDKIAAVRTARDRPVEDVRIIKAKLVKRKKK